MPEPRTFSDETIVEFLLNNALTPEAYRWAMQEAFVMGVDPLKLDPTHLIQDEPWAKPELCLEQLRATK